mmetsp:Transcript_5860/g.9457  ORF Transcript_5860/g.9457 Transcript_5860/m.9457 type:complete len:106 (-) Transcript_5860:3996-4313(-)
MTTKETFLDPSFQERHPRISQASMWSRFAFSWAFPIMKISRESQLTLDQLGGLRSEDAIEKKFELLQRSYFGQARKSRSLLLSILKAFEGQYLFAAGVCIVASIF